MNYRKTMDAAGGVRYRAALYCRLSKDDLLQGESASISNQREMMIRYCRENGWEVAEVYQDDGYTGLNMNRPGLQRLLADAREGRFNMVITKDQSRLGRNHLETGNLMEVVFPKLGIRYIAMNDGVDTGAGDNEIAPFRNILNEMYSRDISKKIHASYHLHATQGLFTGTVAPIGYRKDPVCAGHLIIDEETAPIVRLIFDLAVQGRGPNYIARRLEENRMACPTWWNRTRGYRNTYTKWERKDPVNGRYVWDFTVISGILRNPVYYGAMAAQKVDYRFKVGIVAEKRPEDWIIVEGTHEPIVDRETWDLVQFKIKQRQYPQKNGAYSLFAGLMRCGECGGSLIIRNNNARNPVDVYTCKTYNSHGKHHCTQHRVEFPVLYQLVLEKIRYYARLALSDGDEVIRLLRDSDSDELQAELDAIRRTIEKDEARQEVLERAMTKLYEDLVEGKVTEEIFDMMVGRSQNELQEIRERLRVNRARMEDSDLVADDNAKWVECISRYADLQELTPEILHELIRDIVVHEQIDEEGVRHISIEINFNFRPSSELLC